MNFKDSRARLIERYDELNRELRSAGLCSDAVVRSLHRESKRLGAFRLLKTLAYKPTGVALGCPLPDCGFQSQLQAISVTMDWFLRKLTNIRLPAFAHVPSEFYHVTLVNRTHFDCDYEVGNIKSISYGEMKRIKDIIGLTKVKVVRISFKGLLLTASGRLIVPGYIKECSMFRLRHALYDTLPSLRSNCPLTAHIKLGHLLVHVNRKQLKALAEYIENLGSGVTWTIEFRDLYTPLGRVLL